MMMMKKLKEIFGVGERYMDSSSPPQKLIGIDEMPNTAASRRRDPDPRTAEYLPERLVPANGIEAVAGDGSCWMPWRTETRTGEKWFRRVSWAPGEEPQDIHAYHDALSPDDRFDSGDEFDSETGQKIYDPYLILRNARNRIAARQLAGRSLILDDIGEGDDDDTE